MLNISQFFIVAQAGPVSSTVVGHVKTCAIVALGWMVSGRAIHDKSILGVLIAIGGIVMWVFPIASRFLPLLLFRQTKTDAYLSYSVVMLQHKRKQEQQQQQQPQQR